MPARAPPKGCSFPRIILPLRMGLSPQQVAGMPPGRGGGNLAGGGGGYERIGDLVEALAPETRTLHWSWCCGSYTGFSPHSRKSDNTLPFLFTVLQDMAGTALCTSACAHAWALPSRPQLWTS